MANVSETELKADTVSAEFWTTHINLYSEKMQRLADRYAIAASLISTITGLAVWGTIASSTKWWGQALVCVMAFAAAAVALIPKIRRYNECAVNSLPLSSEYADSLGALHTALEEIHNGSPDAQKDSREAVDKFKDTKKKKDALRPFPWKLEEEINRIRTEKALPQV
jgi:hypothetical protein